MTHRAALLIAACACAALAFTPARTAERTSCTLSIVDQRRVILDDSSTATVDASGIALNGGDALMLGHTIRWPHGGSPGQPGIESGMGILLRSDGRLTLVPSPVRDFVSHPRAIAAAHGGWHALFFTTNHRRAPQVVDSAGAWYGRFDGTTWHDVVHIGSVRAAALGTLNASRLATIGEDLFLAYPFNASRLVPQGAPNAHGVVMLSRRGGRWTQDSLMTWAEPASVDVATRPGRATLEVAIVQGYFENRRLFPQTTFVAPFGPAWGKAVRVSPDSGHGVTTTFFVETQSGPIVTWLDREVGGGSSGYRVQFARGSGSTWTPPTVVGAGEGWPSYAAAPAAGGRMVWFIPIEGNRRMALRAFVTREGIAEGSSDLALPFDNLTPQAATLPDSSVLLLTGEMNQAAYPPAWSMLARARVTCSGGP